MSNEIYEKLEICRKSILQKTNFKPEVAVILGSGLGEYASKIKIEQIIPYTEIEGFPVSTVVGHKGQFVFGIRCWMLTRRQHCVYVRSWRFAVSANIHTRMLRPVANIRL